jgi:hypothetical protein
MRVMNCFEATACYPLILSTAFRYGPTDTSAVTESCPSHGQLLFQFSSRQNVHLHCVLARYETVQYSLICNLMVPIPLCSIGCANTQYSVEHNSL